MRILTRYIQREICSYALIGAAVFTFLFFMVSLERILELVVRNSAPLPSVVEVFAFTLPKTLSLTIPMGVLVGILIGFSRLSADSEITAMRSTGMGAWAFVRTALLFVLIATGLALVNNVWLGPRAAAGLSDLEDRLKSSQASFEVQPRVFYEDFPNCVLYVQDTTTNRGAALWKGVFLADVSTPAAPQITLARRGVVVSEGEDKLHLHLTQGARHESVATQVDQYSISTFGETDVFLPLPPASQNGRTSAPAAEVPTARLRDAARNQRDPADAIAYRIEFHRRWSMVVACLVLALVGIPLGLSSKKGGKSSGFVMTIALVFIYYLISLSGMSLARQGKVPVEAGMWLANAMFFIAGIVMLHRVDRFPLHLPTWRGSWSRLRQFFRGRLPMPPSIKAGSAFERARRRPRLKYSRFPMILDDLILRDFMVYLGLVLCTFMVLMLVFTFFELLRDIVRNRIPLVIVGEYLLNLIPYLLYNMLPLAVLLAVLMTFGLMQKSNEIVAMKATGISVYRILVPILFVAGLLTVGLFCFDHFYLPQVNRRQDALRNQIKGKAAQTYLRPERKWIFGQGNTIYYYEAFDPDQNRFGSIQAFEFDPHSYEITRRIYAARAHWSESLERWVFEQGWTRSFRSSAIDDFRTFDVATFPELNEKPQYFRKEVKQSSEMNYAELLRYIRELQQSGFDVIRLRVQLHRKLAFPIITFVMAVIAIPFALQAGRRGTLTGVATAIGIGVTYWIISGLFEAMGNTNQLPPLLAAWAPDVLFALAGGYLVLKVPT